MRKSRKVMAALLALVMVLASGMPLQGVKASDSYTPTVPAVSTAEVTKPTQAKPGDVIDVRIPVKGHGYTAKDPVITLNLEGLPFELITDITLDREDAKGTKITNIVINKITYICFQLKVKESARKKEYENIPISIITTNSFNEYYKLDVEYAVPYVIHVIEERVLPTFKIVKEEYPDTVKPEDTFDIDLEFQNKGEIAAYEVQISLGGAEGNELIPRDLYNTVDLGRMTAGATANATFAFSASKTITTGVKKLTANVTFKLEDGTSFTEETVFYIEAEGKDETETENSDVRMVSGSYPKKIMAEQNVSIKLKYKNEGKSKVKEVKVQLGGYKEAELLPNFIYDTVELKDLKPGESDTAAFSLTSAKQFTGGTKALTAKITYKLEDGTSYNNTVSIYIEGIVDEIPVTNTMPKLIIQNYDVGTEKLMAGTEFNFSFDVLNSHGSAKADNIKVTISSADNNFSIVEGSSSFLISSLQAGEIKNCEIPLRVKGDAATGGYDLSVTFEYEYAAKDEKLNEVSKSNTIEEKLKIPVYSNDRPMVSNISVGYYEPPKVGELTTLSFEFYNMGKAILYNVTAKLDGDFDSSGNMLVIGNVEPGAGKAWEMDVTPMVEGMGSGTLHISYEDSNGNISTFDESFEQAVDSASTGIDDPGIMDPGMWDDTNGNGLVEAKKEILPIWVFIPVQAVVFLVVLLVTKTIIIKRYKKKKLNSLEDED